MPTIQHRDDDDGDSWDPKEPKGLPASVPEESSPIRRATRPVPTRQRSSSTAFTRTASASDIPSTRLTVGLVRPKLPEFRLDHQQNGSRDHDDDAPDHGQIWDRSKSRSPPLRLSLEGHSSRSSSSPSAQPGSSTSPDLAPRRPFKRSVTVPSRPRIPGTWGDAPERSSLEASPLDSVQETENPNPATGINRFTASNTRRVYVTPAAGLRTYRGTSAVQTQSLVANRYLSAESTSPSSASSSPNSDEAPGARPTPHSSYQPRVLGTSISQSRVALPRVSPTDGHERDELGLHSNPPHADKDLFELDGIGCDSSGHWARELAALELATKDMMSEDEDLVPSPPLESTVQRPSKRKDVSDEPPSASMEIPAASPAPLSSIPHPTVVPPIPPYRGPRTLPSMQETNGPPERYRSHVPGTLAAQRSSIEPLTGNSAAHTTNAMRSVPDSHSSKPGLTSERNQVFNEPVRHRRSPTAPSPQTASAFSSTTAVEGKENRATNGITWGGDAVSAREREWYAHAALGREPQVPPLPSSRVVYEKDRLQLKLRWEREEQERQRQATEEREAEEEREQERLAQEEAHLAEQQAIAARNAADAKAANLREARPARPHVVSADRPAPPPPISSADHRTPVPANHPKKCLYVRKKAYTKLCCVGRGGSSRVYRVLDENNEIYAIKRVTLERADADTIQGYQNEIQLLTRLSGQPGIIKLIDFESSIKKNTIMLVLECGEIDFAALIAQRVAEKFYQPQVACAWRQMLQAVHVIHEEKIVHSDLKPANFVLVKGNLKLIDFGIAKAIANDTTNIQRDQQIGTVNYMSPEAIEETQRSDGKKVMKLGRASDVWSLGCILYQMVYGRPPFHSLTLYPKMKAIPDPNHVIDFPEYTVPLKLGSGDKPDVRIESLATQLSPDLINSMKMCLVRDPKKRGTIPELLAQNWVEGATDMPAAIPLPTTPPVKTPILKEDESIMTQKNMLQLIRYMRTLEGASPMGDEQMSKELFANLKQVARQV